jgi:hypothetical protein
MEASTKNIVFFRSFLQALKPFTPKSVMKFQNIFSQFPKNKHNQNRLKGNSEEKH